MIQVCRGANYIDSYYYAEKLKTKMATRVYNHDPH